jgi:hypothetical protein
MIIQGHDSSDVNHKLKAPSSAAKYQKLKNLPIILMIQYENKKKEK